MFEIFFICFGVIVFFNFSTVRRRPSERHVMMINLAILIYLSSCGTVEAKPIFLDGSSFVPRQEKFELFNSRLKVRKFRPQECVNIIRPFCWDRINVLEFSANSVSKFFCGIIERVTSIQRNSEAITDPGHNESATNSKHPKISSGEVDSEDCHLLLTLLPMYIVVLWWILYWFYYTQRAG